MSRGVQELMDALRKLQVEGVAGEDMQRELSTAEADLVMTIRSLSGDVVMELFQFQGEHFIHSSEYALLFKLPAGQCQRLTGIDINAPSVKTVTDG